MIDIRSLMEFIGEVYDSLMTYLLSRAEEEES